jgi:hypothetical protein
MNSRGSSVPRRAALCAVLALAGCKSPANRAESSTSSTSSTLAVAVAPPAAALAKSKPWFAGAFAGAYEAKLTPVAIKTGAVRDWANDDGKLFSGSGTLRLQVSDDGSVQGLSEGALGAASATGKVEDDTLRVLLSPSDATGMHGVLVAVRDRDGFKGSIQASSSDSLQVRQATIELTKQAN